MEPLTSGASNRIIPILKTLRASLLYIHSLLFSVLLLLLPRRYRRSYTADSAAEQSPRKSVKRWRLEEEDTIKRRALAEGIDMTTGNEDCRWSTFLFFGVRRNALFTRSWFPVTGQKKWVFIFHFLLFCFFIVKKIFALFIYLFISWQRNENIGIKDLKDRAKLACNFGLDFIITLFKSHCLCGIKQGILK
jgi:hypothetical protein